MKRLIITSTFILTLIALAFWGDRLAEQALDAKLGPLLTKELGLPVELAPLKVRLLKLQARSPRLVMGTPGNPAIVATDVQVSLAWSDLLNREIRLVGVSAADLMVRPSRWPDRGNPWPDDYRFLDPWLPKSLRLETGRYVSASGDSYPVKQARWQRKFRGGATVDWVEDRAGGEVAFSGKLESLDELLQLDPLKLELDIDLPDNKDSKISLQTALKPGQKSGYRMTAQVQAAGMNALVEATNDSPWNLPSHSTTKIDKLEPNKLLDLINSFTAAGPNPEPEALLVSALPELALPDHQGHVEIDEIRIEDEVGKDSAFDFTTSEQGLAISSLTSHGPSGILQGQFDIASSKRGWKLNLTADMRARDADASIAGQYLDASWRWRTGHTRLAGQGDTWGALLNSLEGEISLAGAHRGEVDTPVKIAAQLDNHPDAFAVEHIEIELGGQRITGSAALSGTTQRKLTLDINSDQLHLDFLFRNEDTARLPGTAVPEYLDIFPGIEIDGKLSVKDLQGPGLSLARADIALQRAPGEGRLTVIADGASGGKLNLKMEANTPTGKPTDVTLSVDLKEVNIAQVFQQEVLVQTRSNGTISFEGSGLGLAEVFKRLRGRAQLSVDYRRDNNWQRSSAVEEQLRFSGTAALVIEDDRILGLQISNLDIGSSKQDLTGTVSIVDDRTPWLTANLESKKLNLDGILSLIPDSKEQADQTDLLASLKKLGSMRLSLDAKSVVLMDLPVSNMKLEVTSASGIFSVGQLDFTAEDSTLQSHGEVKWKGDHATFKSAIQVSDFDLDRFLITNSPIEHIPVSGTANLDSHGSKLSELLTNLSGQVNLHASQPQTASTLKGRRNLVMSVKRIHDGVSADISTFQLGSNDLTGSLRYHKTSPALLEIDIHGGSLSLLPWEESLSSQQAKAPAKQGASSTVASAATNSADFVGKMILSPIRFFSGPAEAAPGEKYLSASPLAFDVLKNTNAKINGQIESLTSSVTVLKDMSFSGTLNDGLLSIQASAGLNKGKGEIQATINANAIPASAQLTTSFEGVYGEPGADTYPRSGFASLTSRGQSPAALAANLNGTAYLALGQGPLDYKKLSLLNADVGSSMFRALIPGVEQHEPEMECAVTMVVFKDGIGITPYGFAARTNLANLVGRIEVDLTKELLHLKFDSRSREGVGISVGSVFSNTVQVEGPLTDPKVVPHTSAILWRGWAAVMTAGLSVVGETVYKRALGSMDPCKSIRNDIRKDICSTDQPAASSPLVCPQGN